MIYKQMNFSDLNNAYFLMRFWARVFFINPLLQKEKKGSESFEPLGSSYDRFKRVTINFVSKFRQISRIRHNFSKGYISGPKWTFTKLSTSMIDSLQLSKGSRSKAPQGAELRSLKEGIRQRNLAKFDRYCSSMFKRQFLRPGEVQKPRINRRKFPSHGERVQVKMHPKKASSNQTVSSNPGVGQLY